MAQVKRLKCKKINFNFSDDSDDDISSRTNTKNIVRDTVSVSETQHVSVEVKDESHFFKELPNHHSKVPEKSQFSKELRSNLSKLPDKSQFSKELPSNLSKLPDKSHFSKELPSNLSKLPGKSQFSKELLSNLSKLPDKSQLSMESPNHLSKVPDKTVLAGNHLHRRSELPSLCEDVFVPVTESTWIDDDPDVEPTFYLTALGTGDHYHQSQASLEISNKSHKFFPLNDQTNQMSSRIEKGITPKKKNNHEATKKNIDLLSDVNAYKRKLKPNKMSSMNKNNNNHLETTEKWDNRYNMNKKCEGKDCYNSVSNKLVIATSVFAECNKQANVTPLRYETHTPVVAAGTGIRGSVTAETSPSPLVDSFVEVQDVSIQTTSVEEDHQHNQDSDGTCFKLHSDAESVKGPSLPSQKLFSHSVDSCLESTSQTSTSDVSLPDNAANSQAGTSYVLLPDQTADSQTGTSNALLPEHCEESPQQKSQCQSYLSKRSEKSIFSNVSYTSTDGEKEKAPTSNESSYEVEDISLQTSIVEDCMKGLGDTPKKEEQEETIVSDVSSCEVKDMSMQTSMAADCMKDLSYTSKSGEKEDAVESDESSYKVPDMFMQTSMIEDCVKHFRSLLVSDAEKVFSMAHDSTDEQHSQLTEKSSTHANSEENQIESLLSNGSVETWCSDREATDSEVEDLNNDLYKTACESMEGFTGAFENRAVVRCDKYGNKKISHNILQMAQSKRIVSCQDISVSPNTRFSHVKEGSESYPKESVDHRKILVNDFVDLDNSINSLTSNTSVIDSTSSIKRLMLNTSVIDSDSIKCLTSNTSVNNSNSSFKHLTSDTSVIDSNKTSKHLTPNTSDDDDNPEVLAPASDEETEHREKDSNYGEDKIAESDVEKLDSDDDFTGSYTKNGATNKEQDFTRKDETPKRTMWRNNSESSDGDSSFENFMTKLKSSAQTKKPQREERPLSEFIVDDDDEEVASSAASDDDDDEMFYIRADKETSDERRYPFRRQGGEYSYHSSSSSSKDIDSDLSDFVVGDKPRKTSNFQSKSAASVLDGNNQLQGKMPHKEPEAKTSSIWHERAVSASKSLLDNNEELELDKIRTLGKMCEDQPKKAQHSDFYDDDDDFRTSKGSTLPKTPFKPPKGAQPWTKTFETPARHHTLAEDLITPKGFRRPQVHPTTAPRPSQAGICSEAFFLKSLTADMPDYKRHPDAARLVKHFKSSKAELAQRVFQIFNHTVFEDQLPKNFEIEWSPRYTSTAGTFYYKGIPSDYRTKITLSVKICDSPERVRDTLAHELCHAAVKLISGVNESHGRFWKSWARKVNRAFPFMPVIARCHDYYISTKYTYQCVNCKYRIGRHSKSLDTERKVCGHCRGRFEVYLTSELNSSSDSSQKTPATPHTPRTPNKFALFVKECYSEVKKRDGALKHGDVMKILSQQFAEKNKICD